MASSSSEKKPKKEEIKHFKVAQFITESCVKLELNSVTLASACVLYHRFFQECDISEYDPYTIASTSIFLATKVEEEHTRLRDVVNVCYRTLYPNKPPLEIGRKLYDFKDTISNCELLLLRVLKFRVTTDHPHKYMLHYLLSLSHLFNPREWRRHPIAQASWAILRDCYLGKICLNNRPQLVSISCISLALMSCKAKVPFSDCSDIQWWKVVHESTTEKEILTCVEDIVDLYNIEKHC